MVDVLIQFLSSLKTPIIPVSVQDQIVEYGFKDYAASKTVLNAELSLLHFNCFMYVCLFLKEFLNDNVDALASVFAPVFFRRDLSTDLFKRKSKLVVMNIINGRILI